MRQVCLAAFVVSLAAPAFAAGLDTRLRDDLVTAFEILAGPEDAEAAGLVIEAIVDGGIPTAQWREVFDQFFDGGVFSVWHVRFWQYAIENTSGKDQARVGLLSAHWAVAALQSGLVRHAEDPAQADSLVRAIAWLQTAGPNIGGNVRPGLFAAFKHTFETHLQPGPPQTPEAQALWFELAVVARRCAPDGREGRTAVGDLLGLSGVARQFWEAHGMFLLDDGGLDDWQLASLDRLISEIPPGLYFLDAFVVPESTGIVPGAVGLGGAVEVAFISPVPMTAESHPGELPFEAAPPVAPDFTLAAACEMVRAIQRLQFARRPGLAMRRDAILEDSLPIQGAYIRHRVPRALYAERPDEFLPMIAYVWFLDTDQTLEHTLALFELDTRACVALDSFLLFADMMSGGGDAAPIFKTDGEGRTFGGEAPLARSGPDGLITAIDMLGSTWAFTVNDAGAILGVHRE